MSASGRKRTFSLARGFYATPEGEGRGHRTLGITQGQGWPFFTIKSQSYADQIVLIIGNTNAATFQSAKNPTITGKARSSAIIRSH